MNAETTERYGTETKRYLQPCFLVVGEVQMSGCLSYRHSDREETIGGNGNGARCLDATWRTAKHVIDIDEQRNMAAQRAVLTGKVRRLGAHVSGLGVLVPLDREADLRRALDEVRAEVRSYNDTARYTSLTAYYTWFVVRDSDDAVASALYDRAQDVLRRITEAARAGAVADFRRALADTAGLETILPSETALRLEGLVAEARTAARAAVREAKGLDPEAAARALREALCAVPVDGLRAALVESAPPDDDGHDEIPSVSLTDVRWIE